MGSTLYVHIALTVACLAMLGIVLLDVRQGRRHTVRLDKRQLDELRASLATIASEQAVALNEAAATLRTAVADVEVLLDRRGFVGGAGTPPNPPSVAVRGAAVGVGGEAEEERTTHPGPRSGVRPETPPRSGVRAEAPPRSGQRARLPVVGAGRDEEDEDDITRVLGTPPMVEVVERPSGAHPVFVA